MRFPLLFACAACLASCLENRYPTDDPPAVVPADPIAASAGPDFDGRWRAQFEGDSARIRAWQKGSQSRREPRAPRRSSPMARMMMAPTTMFCR